MSAARDIALRVLARVEGEGAYATLALGAELERSGASAADRRLATELTYGTLRHQTRLDAALVGSARGGKLKVSAAIRRALRVAAYQLLFLERIPDRAAVDESVAVVRRIGGQRAAGFANAVLRQLSKQGEPPLPDAADVRARIIAEHSMPKAILALLADALPADALPDAAAALNRSAPLWGRTNVLRTDRDALLELLRGERDGVSIELSPKSSAAFRLRKFIAPATSPSFTDGLWTVQDLGAQRVSDLCAPQSGMTILDACAGVGGKSTHLAELCGDDATIDALDISASKLDALVGSMERLGLRSIAPVQGDLLEGGAPRSVYDCVLLDAPCTGLGVLRRHPEAKWRFDEADLDDRVQLQRDMLDACAGLVRPGGRLVYSVCSFTSAEGPAQAAAFLSRHPEFEQVDAMRTWPHEDDADAFFGAAFERR